MKYSMHMIAFTTSLLLAQSFVGFPPFSLVAMERSLSMAGYDGA